MARSDRTEDRTVITDAPVAHSDDLEMRQKRYAITMAFRTACFVSLFWLRGWWAVLPVLGAALLPGIAVVLANARDNRTPPAQAAPAETPPPAPMLPAGHVIRGEVVDDHASGPGGATAARG